MTYPYWSNISNPIWHQILFRDPFLCHNEQMYIIIIWLLSHLTASFSVVKCFSMKYLLILAKVWYVHLYAQTQMGNRNVFLCLASILVFLVDNQTLLVSKTEEKSSIILIIWQYDFMFGFRLTWRKVEGSTTCSDKYFLYKEHLLHFFS